MLYQVPVNGREYLVRVEENPRGVKYATAIMSCVLDVPYTTLYHDDVPTMDSKRAEAIAEVTRRRPFRS